MWRQLAIAVLGALLLGPPSVAKDQQSTSHATGTNATQNKQPVPPTHIVIAPPLPPRGGKPESPNSQDQAAEKPLPRFERPEWVIVYVTVVYAFIAWLTLLSIKRQANTMDKQFADAKESGKHTETLAQQAVKQSNLT